jgi:hypothetical protein
MNETIETSGLEDSQVVVSEQVFAFRSLEAHQDKGHRARWGPV